MDDTTRTMLLIKSLYNDAHVALSEYTGQWFVSARIDIGGDGLLTGGKEHRDSPQEAVAAYMEWLTSVPYDKYLVVNGGRENRRHYRWNGGAFAEIPILTPAMPPAEMPR